VNNQPRFGTDERNFVYSVARRIVETPDAAEDVAQEAMILAFRHRDAFRGHSRYRTWLYRIAATAALGHLRSAKRSREYLARTDEPAHVDMADPRDSAETQLADREAAEIATEMIETLDAKYRDVIVLRTELTEVETAERLGITVANVKVRAHRARQQLRDAFERAA
jgi:RNA polymerase sigma-70 factor (ECF subfamily)